MDANFNRPREARVHSFATGTRDRARAQTLGSVAAGGPIAQGMSADELVEWALLGIKGGVTPTTPVGATDARLWTFKPGDLDSATIERNDGARIRRLLGARVNSMQFQGSVQGDNRVNMELFGTDLVTLGALTAALTSRTPSFIEGWEANAYIDDFAATPGTTLLGGVMNWNIQIQNNLGRVYTANNTLGANRVSVGEIGISGSILIDAQHTDAAAEYTNYDAETYRILRLEFGMNEEIEPGFERFVTLDVPGAWSAVDLGGSDQGVRAYEFSINGIYEPTIAAALQLRLQNDRTAAW